MKINSNLKANCQSKLSYKKVERDATSDSVVLGGNMFDNSLLAGDKLKSMKSGAIMTGATATAGFVMGAGIGGTAGLLAGALLGGAVGLVTGSSLAGEMTTVATGIAGMLAGGGIGAKTLLKWQP